MTRIDRLARRAARPSLVRTTALVPLVFVLAACVPPEERAEERYQSALALLAEGDVARAKLELRNVFDLDGFHRDARDLYAEIVLEEGLVREAYGQTLRLIEQYPDDVEGRRRLALLATQSRQWEEARRHADAGLAVDPEDLGLRAVDAVLDYQAAVEAEDEDAMAAAAQRAGAALAEDPSLTAARLVLIDRVGREGRPEAALALVDDGLALDEDDLELRRLRIGFLAQSGDQEALGTELAAPSRRFPDDDAIAETYLRWLGSQDRLDEAEAFLRERAEAGGWEERATLLQFLRQARGAEGLRAELDELIADPEAERRPLLRAMRAELDFAAGRTEEAVAEMIALTEEVEEGDLEVSERARLHLALARMQREQGDRVGARASLESALEIDPTLADAYKQRAVWALEADDPAAAITALRAALGNAPRDPQIMSLMAQAHTLNGEPALAGEMLARAVELSNSGVEESLRYAEYLVSSGRTGPAESVIADARRLAPGDVRLISAAGRLMVAGGAWTRLNELIDQLRAVGSEQADAMADEFAALAFAAQNRSEELQALLRGIADGDGAGADQAEIALLRTELASGDVEAALARAQALVEMSPDSARMRLVLAAALAAADREDEAEATLRGALETDPGAAEAWLALHRLVGARAGTEAADAVLAEALAAVPDDPRLLLQEAGRLERRGRIPDAIAIYEDLYVRDRSSMIVANNLASLIGMTTEDPEELDRAERIARRLRSSQVPALQDTYGWLAFRTGDVETALEYLEPAAQGLSGDPFVQFHLGTAQAAAERPEAAETLRRAKSLVGGRREMGFDADAMDALEARIDAALEGLPATPAAEGTAPAQEEAAPAE